MEESSEKSYYEKMPLYTSVMASLGFYFLIFIGLINHIIFTPKVATEKNRKVKNEFVNIYSNYYRSIHLGISTTVQYI